MRVVGHRSKLPSEVEESPSLETSKMRRDTAMRNLLWAGVGQGFPRPAAPWLHQLLQWSEAMGCYTQLLGEALQGIIRLDIGHEKIVKSEL